MSGIQRQVYASATKILLAAFILIVLSSPRIVHSEEPEPPADCVACHQDTFVQGVGHRHVHAPFMNQECRKCHGEHTVRRKTGTPSPAAVPSPIVLEETDYATRRTLNIRGLAPGTVYRVDIAWTNLRGERTEESFPGIEVLHAAAGIGEAGTGDSELGDIRTAQYAYEPNPRLWPNGSRPFGQAQPAADMQIRDVSFFLNGPDLGLRLETSSPARVRVTCREDPEHRKVTPEASVGGISYEVDLTELRTGRALTIDSCSQGGCHSPGSLGVSHPVGVAVRDASLFSIDVPVLEGGIVTCVTCHKTHGGEKKYFAQADLSREICLNCHTEYK